MILYEYQEKYIASLPHDVIMAADVGTGKTLMALAHYERTQGVETPLLILAPASKVRTGDWEREIALWFDGREMPNYTIYSYEKWARDVTKRERLNGKRGVWETFMEGDIKWAVIADEVHALKAPTSKRGKYVSRMVNKGKVAQLIGLSATPMPNGWQDFANYSILFGFYRTKSDFERNHLNIVRYKGFPEIKGYINETLLKQMWSKVSRRLTRAEATDLPDRQFIGVNFDKPKHYTKIAQTKTLDGELLDTPSKLLHTLRQQLHDGKLDFLSDLLEGTTENVVIFYNYDVEREAILELLKKKHKQKTVYEQNGHAHEIPLKDEWETVENSVTVAHYKSGGTGVEMTYASVTIYFSPTYSYGEYIQSIGRTHRNGQEKKTVFYNFRTRDTIEAAVYKVLKNKKSFQEKVYARDEFGMEE